MTNTHFINWPKWAQITAVITGFYVILTPLILATGWYIGVQVHTGVEEAIKPLETKIERNKDEASSIKMVIKHYHDDASRFFERGGNLTIIPYKEEY